ncbi:MAG TPA: ThiF family adenylyltransferase [Thermoanaerobaculia bacterium]|nr:ThiF family adenylyltransferase [Thermoanaerobaculia bacterium]
MGYPYRNPKLQMDLPQPEPDSRLVLNHETGRYLRLGLREFDWLMRLDGQVHESDIATLLGIEPSMSEELIRRLTAAKLICSSDEPVKLQSFEQVQKEERVQMRRVEWGRLGQLRIHVGEPNAFLDRIAPLTGFLMTRSAIAAGVLLSIAGFGVGVAHGRQMGTVLQSFPWSVTQILVIIALLFAVTVLHELGHAAACRHFGAPVRSVGVMLYYLQPAAYADITDSWQLRNRWHRVAISSAGIYVQALLTSAAVLLWTALRVTHHHGDILVVFIVMNLSIIVMNVLPFVRLDGYWMVSNALPMTNLRDRSLEWVRTNVAAAATRRPIEASRLRYNAVLNMSPMGRALLFCFGISSMWFGSAMWMGGLAFLFRITGWLGLRTGASIVAVVGMLLLFGVAFVARLVLARRKALRSAPAAAPARPQSAPTAFLTYAIDDARPIRLNPHATVLRAPDGTFVFGWTSPDALTLEAPATLLELTPLLRDGSKTLAELRQSPIWVREFENVVQRLWHHRDLRYSTDWELSEDDLRYQRQLGWFSLNAQVRGKEIEALRRLQDASVTILGVGGLGTHMAWNLASCGIGELHLVDADRIELTNLNRQLFFTPADIGRYKIDVAAERLLEFNPKLRIRKTYKFVQTIEEISEAIDGSTFVVRSLDNPVNAIVLINEACVRAGIPFSGGGFLAQGTVVGATVIPGESSCLACTPIEFPQFDRASFGTLGPMVSATAGLLANEVVIHVAKLGRVKTAGRLLYINTPGLDFQFQENPRNENCSICGAVQERVSA